METKVKTIIDSWQLEQPKYENIGKVASAFIKHNISEYEIFPEVTFRTKELLSIIKKVKKNSSIPNYSINDLTDKLGLRIICSFQEELKLIDTFLRKYFTIKKAEYKKENLDFNKLDYVSNHYDVTLNCQTKEFKKFTELQSYVFEIQVRTLNQHSWSNTAHTLSYKQEEGLPPNLKRKLYRLLSLYEIADDEFSAVNNALKENKNNLVYNLLRKLEGKFYKFARIDFDREISLKVISILLSYLNNESQQHTLIHEITNFINTNEDAIQNIFDENRQRYFEVLFLTQPEIFIVWYMLINNKYQLQDNWENDFDSEDLEQIQTLWGSEL